MKVFALFALFVFASAQDVERITVTQQLLGAQRELTIGHEFAELFLADNRQLLSDYLERIERIALDRFMEAYALIKNKGIETREAMEQFTETSFCKDNVRARWELQVTRYGQKLSQCLGVTDGYIKQFTTILNRLHDESRAYSNVIPNSSINILSSIGIFDGRDNLGDYINDEMRRLLFRAFDLYQEFEEFIGGISVDFDQLIEQYTECYRTLPVSFNNESDQDLLAIARCYQD